MANRPHFSFEDILKWVKMELPAGASGYLVGGAVRDRLLRQESYDLDFVLSEGSLAVSRRVANRLGGAYYPLDEERETGRVILIGEDDPRQVLDFALLSNNDLESDLQARDFTINAMAIDLAEPDQVIDPLGGADDLRSRKLRQCSSDSISADPIRCMRAVRMAGKYRLYMLPETTQAVRSAAGLLTEVSAERMRDELFRILDNPRPATNIRLMEKLGLLPYVMPELGELKGVLQSHPHHDDVWRHTLNVLARLEEIIAVLGSRHDEDISANWVYGYLSVRLGRFRDKLSEHLSDSISPGRNRKLLLYLAALYHDAGKPLTYQQDESRRIRFFKHDIEGSKLISARARKLRLNNEEIDWLKIIVRNHMRPLLLAQTERQPSKRAVYRYFRSCQAAGVDICLLSLADTLATYGSDLTQEIWIRDVGVVRVLLEAWWEHKDEEVSPPVLIGGRDLIHNLGVKPGPVVGELLEAVREAQASGEINDREEALTLARGLLDDRKNLKA